LGSVGKGGSGARFFLCDDDQEYVVKFVEAQTKTTVNEWVAGSLALQINLPTPNIVQVNISKEIIELSDALKKRNIQSGLHVGIERLPKEVSWDFQYVNDKMLVGKTLVNADDLYGVITFDNWVLNSDRNNQGNNMIQILNDSQMKFIMIDFGHCFTNNTWDQKLNEVKNSENLVPIFPFIKNRLIDFKEFEKWISIIEQFDENTIKRIIESVPKSWNLSENERVLLLDFIKSRKQLIRQIITNNGHALVDDG